MHGPEFQFLQSIDILSGLDDRLIEFLASKLHKKRFKKGDHIFFQGDTITQFYFLEMGRVGIYKSDPNGKKLTLWFIEPKDTFCLAALHNGTAFASAEVIEDAMIYALSKKDLDAFIAQAGEIATRLLHCMSQKMAAYSTMIEEMAFMGITARLAKALLEYQKKDESGLLTCDLTQGELAALIGTCREVVARSLKKLRDDGIISTTRTRGIEIIQPDNLKNLCD